MFIVYALVPKAYRQLRKPDSLTNSMSGSAVRKRTYFTVVSKNVHCLTDKIISYIHELKVSIVSKGAVLANKYDLKDGDTFKKPYSFTESGSSISKSPLQTVPRKPSVGKGKKDGRKGGESVNDKARSVLL